MPLSIRTYHELTEPDRSNLPGQIGEQRRRVAERLAAVGRVVAGEEVLDRIVQGDTLETVRVLP